MAPKVIKKGKQSSAKKELSSAADANAIPWPDLPRQLLYFMARQKDLMIENLGWCGVSKSWRAIYPSRQCIGKGRRTMPSPQLFSRSDHDDDNDHYPRPRPRSHILSIPYLPGFYLWNSRRRGPKPWIQFRGCSHGRIVTETEEEYSSSSCSRKYTLYAPFWIRGTLPTWDDPKIPFKFATVSDKGVMVLTGTCRPAFVIYNYRTHSSGWVPYDCTFVDPYASSDSDSDSGGKPMTFTNAIGFKDKFYALSLQGALAVIEEEIVDNNDDHNHSSQFKITAFGKNRAVPSAPPSSSRRHFIEYLIESNGEILLAFLISSSTKKNDFDDVQVFRLDLGRLSWVKMESVGDRALFLGTNCCMSVSAVNAVKVGCRANCVYYFTHDDQTTIKKGSWKEFDMTTACIIDSNML